MWGGPVAAGRRTWRADWLLVGKGAISVCAPALGAFTFGVAAWTDATWRADPCE